MASTPVQKELRRIAADYRRYFVLKGLISCWLVAALFGALLLAVYGLTGVAVPFAFAMVALVAGIPALAIIIRRGSADFALREIARLIEKDDPKLNSLLLAAIEQEPDPKTGQLSFLQIRVIREALENNRKSPWGQRFTERLFFTQGTHLAALASFGIVLCAIAFVTPQAKTSLGFARDTKVEITPGNASLEKGSAVAIVAQLQKPAASGVNLVYVSQSGGEKKVPMARSLNDPLYGFTLPSVEEKTKYHIEYNGTRSSEFTLDVFEYPELKRADAELTFPEYTGMPKNRIEDTRRVSAVEGTKVDYTLYLNKNVRSARLMATNDSVIVLSNTAPNAVSYATSINLENNIKYSLELVDADGRTNKLPADFILVALRNEAPKLKLQSPRGDQRVSALQEVRFDAEAQDDFGLSAVGISYSVPGRKTEEVVLATATNGVVAKPHEKQALSWMLPVETISAEVGELVSYYLWADDRGPDGQIRRTQSDMYFAEIRPFEEIFRQGQGGEQGGQGQQQGGGGQNPATKLLDLQKEIVTATWNLQRREKGPKPGAKFKDDVTVVRDSQRNAIEQANDVLENLRDEKSKNLGEQALTAMDSAAKNLDDAAGKNQPNILPTALEFEQSAYQALLKLQAREYQVSRNRNQRGGGGGGQQRAQRQLDQLELKDEENRYEKESQASPLQTPEQRESLQVLNRLKELARRQQDMSERLKELQTALNEAKTSEEKKELERQLKRLQEEQQQIVQDMDEVRQRMAQPENQSRMADARQQLDQSRQQSREAARQLENENVGQALNSSSRAQQQLQQLSDDFRKSTSKQFSEEMRQMRQQARDLDQKQQDLAQKMDEMKETKQRSLGDEGPRKELLEGLAQQRSTLTNLLTNMRQVTEQAEAAEPLLSRQLYETLRRNSQASPDKALELASQLLERNLIPQSGEAQQKATETIRDLREGVERAATEVLGDEAESLRFAQKELQDLTDRAERELNSATGRGTNNNARAASGEQDPTSTNRLRTAMLLRDGLTNRLGAASGRNGTNSLAMNRGERGQRNGQQNGERGEESANQGGENGEQTADAQNGREGQQGQEGQEGQQSQSGQQGGGQRGQQPGRGERNQGQAQAQNGGGGGQQGGARDGQRADTQRGGGRFDQWGGGGGGGNRGGWEGPLTGGDYTRWSDRLRDIEEVLQDPLLRTDVARVREQARTFRQDFKRHAEPPQWDLVQAQIITPLRIIQNRVADELARHNSREAVVPVDRDPVPQKYADAVSRYYERLGKE